MLKVKAEIEFTVQDKNYNTKYPLRIPFAFGEELLFSGEIISENKEYLFGQKYIVDVFFFTVEDEAYAAISPLLQPNMDLVMCAGRRIIGVAKLLEYEYEGIKVA
jgi:hypothetical protein